MAATLGPLELLKTNIIKTAMVGRVAAVEGDVGLGKTAMIEAIARELGADCHVLIGSQMDPTDVGFPVTSTMRVLPYGSEDRESNWRTETVVKMAPREWAVRLNNAKRAFLFIDELTCCPLAVQAVLLRTMTDWYIGDYALDRSRVSIVCAYNPPDIAANGQELAMPMRNRLVHFKWPMDTATVKEWCDAFIGYWGSPPRVGLSAGVPESCMIRARQLVAGFVARKPHAWHYHSAVGMKGEDGDKKKKSSDAAMIAEATAQAFSTPRSWDSVAAHVGLCLQDKVNPIEGLTRYAATVGSGWAQEFTAYIRDESLPDPEWVLAHADQYVPSGRPDIDSSTLSAVAAVVDANLTLGRYLDAWHVISSAAKKRDGVAPAHEAAMIAVLKLAKHLKPANQPRLYDGTTAKERGRAVQVLAIHAAPYKDFLAKNGLGDLSVLAK